MIIKKATYNDANKISYLIQKNTEANPNNYTLIQIKTWKNFNTPSKIKKQISNRDIYCGFENGKLVGTIGLKNNEVVGFYVSPSKRGQGNGSKLFDFIETEAKKRLFKTLYLTSTPSAVSFYQNKGFKKIKNVIVTIDGISYEEVDMVKNY